MLFDCLPAFSNERDASRCTVPLRGSRFSILRVLVPFQYRKASIVHYSPEVVGPTVRSPRDIAARILTDLAPDTDQAIANLLSFLHGGGVTADAKDFAKRLELWVHQGLRPLERLPLGIG
jgi:hypothetical protein